jgi:hypothetical protein
MAIRQLVENMIGGTQTDADQPLVLITAFSNHSKTYFTVADGYIRE